MKVGQESGIELKVQERGSLCAFLLFSDYTECFFLFLFGGWNMRGREWTCVVDGRVRTCLHFSIYTSAFSVSLARAKRRSSITIPATIPCRMINLFQLFQIIVRFSDGGVNP